MGKKRNLKASDEDFGRLLELQQAVERTAALAVETKAVHKAAKSAHEAAQTRLGEYLYALHHGLPLFDGEEGAQAEEAE